MPNVLLILITIVACAGPAVLLFRDIRNTVYFFQSRNRFTASVHPRAYIEKLIATANDCNDSTLIESRKLIATDADNLPVHLRPSMMEGVNDSDIVERIKSTRAILRKYYLPRATREAAE